MMHPSAADENNATDSRVSPIDGADPADAAPQSTAVFTVLEPVLTTGVSDISRAIIVSLLVIANLVQVRVIQSSSLVSSRNFFV